MALRKRVSLTLLVCGVIGLIVLPRDKEPSYQGKTLTEWMNIYCWPSNPTVADMFPRKIFFEGSEVRQKEAADAIRQIGTNAIPTFLEWEDKDFRIPWKAKLHAALPKSFQ